MTTVDFLNKVSSLKTIPRSGWITHNVGIGDVESVASHSCLTSIIAMVMADEISQSSRSGRPDIERVLRLALLHDVPEVLTFDISHQFLDGLGRSGERIRRRLESSAATKILSSLTRKAGGSYRRLLTEYGYGRSLEARIVRAADSLDILFQAVAYMRMGYSPRSLDPIWKSTAKKIRSLGIPAASRLVVALEAEKRRLTAG
jgi:5'-deoxynucleotidase YfbR-like HD superfamily hydrolase